MSDDAIFTTSNGTAGGETLKPFTFDDLCRMSREVDIVATRWRLVPSNYCPKGTLILMPDEPMPSPLDTDGCRRFFGRCCFVKDVGAEPQPPPAT